MFYYRIYKVEFIVEVKSYITHICLRQKPLKPVNNKLQ